MIALTIALAAVVGALLGLLGGGGSVLAVPLLVFVAGLSPHEAAGTSLFVVALTSLVGLVPHARAGRIRWRQGAVFGLAGMIGASLGAVLAGHVPGSVLLAVFAVLMLLTAGAMIRGRRLAPAAGRPVDGMHLRIVLLGFGVGAMTGFVGAGGGFVIVPALVLLAGLPMAEAVGTSLLVVTMQATAGLAGHLAVTSLDWPLAIAVATSSVLGVLVGGHWTGRFDPEQMRRGFGWFILLTGLFVTAIDLPGPFSGWAIPISVIAFGLVAGVVALHHRLVPADQARGPAVPATPTAVDGSQEPSAAPVGAESV